MVYCQSVLVCAKVHIGEVVKLERFSVAVWPRFLLATSKCSARCLVDLGYPDGAREAAHSHGINDKLLSSLIGFKY